MRLSLGLGLVFAAVAASGCGARTAVEQSVALGNQALPGYHIQAGASAPAPDFGFVVTGNGAGGFRIIMSDSSGASTLFTATITTDTAFDPQQTLPITGQE